jgi:hypothetical protein
MCGTVELTLNNRTSRDTKLISYNMMPALILFVIWLWELHVMEQIEGEFETKFLRRVVGHTLWNEISSQLFKMISEDSI